MPNKSTLQEGMDAWENFAKGNGFVLLHVKAQVMQGSYRSSLEVKNVEIVGAPTVRELEVRLHDKEYQHFFSGFFNQVWRKNVIELLDLAHRVPGRPCYRSDVGSDMAKSIFLLLDGKKCVVVPGEKDFVQTKRGYGLFSTRTIEYAIRQLAERTVGEAPFAPQIPLSK